MDIYFKRHDGQAVNCEEFFASMRDANDADFANFLLWYSQAGTPLLKVTSSYDAATHTFTLKFSQEVPPTPGQPVKEPVFIPVVSGLLDPSGKYPNSKDMPLSSVYHDGALRSLQSTANQLIVQFLDSPRKRKNLSSSIYLNGQYLLYCGVSALQSVLNLISLIVICFSSLLMIQMTSTAGQVLARKLMFSLATDFQKGEPLVLNPKFVQGLRSILCDSSLDKAITLPGEGEIMDMMKVADPDAVQSFIRKQLASELKADFLSTVENNRSSEEFIFNHLNMARRALNSIALALAAIAQNPGKIRGEVLADFYTKWQDDFLVVNKWFALQAMSDVPGNVENVRNLLSHPAYDLRNPNKVYSLIGGFCSSPVNFHAKDGSGYKFLGEIVVQLDKINPQVASRMVSAFSRWRRYDETRQNLANAQLEMIMSANGLSENVFEIASKCLAA